MRMVDLILKKREGKSLSQNEIEYMIQEYTAGNIPDYQMSAMMMAVYFNGMSQEETLNLTMAMANSGETLDLSKIHGIKVDKHSTGGVGDKTSLSLTPIVSACGLKVAKMSGRGLGHTGGTIDKLESFPGFSTEIPIEKFIENVNQHGIAIMGQTRELAPADKKLYALRDVTATVDQMSLIASSIMSKKLAAGADAIVLDVKTGSGAFMKREEDAFLLAKEMVRIGNGAGRHTIAVVSDMDEPLGNAVGNALEVKEAIATLKGEGPKDFTELVYTLGTQMLLAGKMTQDKKEAQGMIRKVIQDRSALKKLAEFVEAQGGKAEDVYHPERLIEAPIKETVFSPKEGYISRIICDEIGMVSLILGGGRETKEDTVDLGVGLVLQKKVGDYVEKGEPLAVIHASDQNKLEEAKKRFIAAYHFAEQPVEKHALIKGIILQ